MTSPAFASATGDEVDEDSGDLSSEYFDAPLQLSDIMPKNRRLYDKMRPPKYKGKLSASNLRPKHSPGSSLSLNPCSECDKRLRKHFAEPFLQTDALRPPGSTIQKRHYDKESANSQQLYG